jgi:TolB-like protein
MSGTASPGARRSPAWRHLMPWLAVVLLGAALSGSWLLHVLESPPSLPAQPALVVLPLHAAGGGAQQTALAEGLSRDLIARLAHAEGLHVIAWPSALRAQAEQLDLQQIGTQLHASYALQGNLRLADDHLLVEVRLQRIADARMLWAQAYTHKREEAGVLVHDISTGVADALALRLPVERSDTTAPVDASVMQQYLSARHLLDAHDRAHALELLRTLTAGAPGFAPAHATLARTLAAALRTGPAAEEDLAEIARTGKHALDLDARQADAHAALAILACRRMEWQACMDGFARALALAPADSDARLTYAYWLAGIGYVDRALEVARSAWRDDPLNYDTNFAHARLLDTLGHHDDALHFLDSATPPSPGLVYARWHNAVWRNDLAAAREFAAAMPHSDGFRESYAGVTEALSDPLRWPQIQPMIGSSERANGHINTLRIMMPNPDYRVEIDGLERMLRDSWPSYYLLLWMPEYAAMRRDPAFQEFLQRTHIIDYWRAHGFPQQCHVSGDLALCD